VKILDVNFYFLPFFYMSVYNQGGSGYSLADLEARLAADEAITAAQQAEYAALDTLFTGLADSTYEEQTQGNTNQDTLIAKAFQVATDSTYLASITMNAFENDTANYTLYQVAMQVELANSSTGTNPVLLTRAPHQYWTSNVNAQSQTSQSNVTMNCLVPFTTSSTQDWLYITVFVGSIQSDQSWELPSLAVTLIQLY